MTAILILQHEDLKLQENHTTLLTHSYISLQQLLQCVVITYPFPSLAVFNQYLGNLLLFFKIKSYCSKVTGLLKMYKAKIPLRCWPLSQTRIWKAASKTRKKQQNLRLSNYHNTLSVDSGTVREPGQSTDCRLYVRVHRNNHQTRKFSGENVQGGQGVCMCDKIVTIFNVTNTTLNSESKWNDQEANATNLAEMCVCIEVLRTVCGLAGQSGGPVQ